MALATAADVKSYLGVQGAGDDALFGTLVASAEAFFYEQIERPSLEEHAFTETLDGTGKDYIMTRHWPILTVTSLLIGTESVPAQFIQIGSRATKDSRMVYLAPEFGKVFTRGRRNVYIAGTAGYSAIPADVKQAVIEITARVYQRRKRIDEVSKQVGGETVSFSTADLTDFARKTIGIYQSKVTL